MGILGRRHPINGQELFLVGWGTLIIVGVFEDRAVAERECTTSRHWVQPLVLNQGGEFPKGDRYYPKK